MQIICEEVFEPGQVEVVQGAIAETTVLLDSGKFDKIFYTGSPAVGSIIAEKAGKSLTPCVLELGGKSPVFITPNLPRSKWKTAIRRIYFSSFANSGQVCVAADYILCHSSIYDEFVSVCLEVLKEFYPVVDANVQYTRMIHERAYKRIRSILETSKGELKGVTPISDPSIPPLCIPPTLISNVTWDDSSMKEENFGPILPIVKYSVLDDAIDKVLERHDTPLVQYIFSTSQAEIDHITTRIRSGDCLVNDTMLHVAIEDAPFGGIGISGYGSYHGPWTFKAFTHERTLFKQAYWVDFLLKVRYPPYTSFNTKISKLTTEEKPNFDRNGKTVWDWKLITFFIASGVLLGAIINKYREL